MTRKLIILFLVASLCHSLFEDNPQVIPMSIKEQQNYFKETDFLVVSIVYDGTSDKSWQLSRTLLDLTDKLSTYVKFVSFDCSSEPGVCAESILPDLPAVNLIIPNKNYSNSKDRVTEKPYIGTISAKEIGEAITIEIPYLGEILDSSTISEFLDREGNKTILFTNKEHAPLIFKGISSKFRNRLEVGIVFEVSSEISQEYDVTEYPTLLVIKEDESEIPEKFKGRHEFKDLVRFLQPFARLEKKVVEIEDEEEERVKDEEKEKEEEEQQQQPEETTPALKYISVDEKNLEEEIKKSTKMVLVHFHSESNSEDWEKIQEKFEGVVTILDFSCLNNDFCESNLITSLPSLRLYSSFSKYSDYPSNSLKSLEKQIIKDLKTEYSTITAKNIRDQINSLYHSGKVLCLLVTKESVPLAFKYLATRSNVQNFVKFVHLNADSESVTEFFELPRYPVILTIFHTDLKRRPQTMDYGGDLENYVKLAEFVEKTSLNTFFRTRPSFPDEDLEDILQIYEPQTWSSKCLKKKGYCLIGFLPENEDLRLLKFVKTIMDLRKINLNVFWTDGNCFTEFREKFEVTDAPGLALVSPENRKIWTFTEQINESQVFNFVESALLGQTEGKHIPNLDFVQGTCGQKGKKPKKHRIHLPEAEDL